MVATLWLAPRVRVLSVTKIDFKGVPEPFGRHGVAIRFSRAAPPISVAQSGGKAGPPVGNNHGRAAGVLLLFRLSLAALIVSLFFSLNFLYSSGFM